MFAIAKIIALVVLLNCLLVAVNIDVRAHGFIGPILIGLIAGVIGSPGPARK